MSEVIARLVAATVLAGMVELVVLRLFTRTAVHVPGLSALAEPYGVLAGIGRFAYYAAALLLIATLCVLAWEWARHRTRTGIAVAASLLLFLGASALARAGLAPDGALDLATVVAVAVVAVCGIAAPAVGNSEMARRGSLTLFSSAFLAAALYGIAQAGGIGSSQAWLLPLSEVLVLLWCIEALLLTPGRIDRGAVALGIAVAACVFGALAVSEATVKVLLLWNFGVTGLLPAWSYALAFGAVTYALVAALRSGRSELAVALALLAIGGIGLHSTYQTGMVLLGLVLLGVGRPALSVLPASAAAAAPRSTRREASAPVAVP